MDDASIGEPQIGEPPPFTRNDLATARRMVRRGGVFDEADDIEQEAELDGVPISLVAAQLRIPRGTAYTRSRQGRAVVGAQLRRWEKCDARGAARRWPDAEWERGRCG